MRIGFAPVASLVFLIFAGPSTVRCAETPGVKPRSLAGKIKDVLGRPIPGAAVDLQNSLGKIEARTRSNAKGRFTFKAVPRGTYAVVVHKKGFRPGTAVATVGATSKPVEIALEAETAISIPITARRLAPARNAVSAKTGGSVYSFSEKAIQELPQGSNSQLNQVLLQAPGVAQDSFGQVHVRGEHGDLQYRINGVQLPEGITGFGQVLSPRFAQSISLLTGALPAEFGLRTAGVVDIKAREAREDTGSLEFYGGQRGTEQPSLEYGGNKGNFNYFVTGQYIHTDLGVEPPTPGPTAIHDTAHEGDAFGYFSYLLNPTTRLSLITGASVNHFEIPNNPGQPQVFSLIGVPTFPSANLDERQFEQNYFGVLALQGAIGSSADYQLAPFSRYSTVSFNPDHIGDLIFDGAAAKVFRSDLANGFQADSSYHGFARHTISIGGYFDAERAEIDNHEATFPALGGVQTSDIPISIVDDTALQTWSYSVYAQDEWKPFDSLTLDYGVRFDLYDGLVRADQASPRAGFQYTPIKGTTLHAGYARYFSPPATELVTVGAIKKFANTTAAPASNGNSTPTVERDHYFDAGITQQAAPGLTLGVDSYYKKAADLIDEGQFGPALIFENFNYAKGRVYGVEFTSSYNRENLYTYANFAYSVAQATQVESGQFNFAPNELRFIDSHYVFLDHDQTFTSSVGGAYRWLGLTFSADGLYGSGLRRGFANTGNLPYYIQVNAAVAKPFDLPRVGHMEARLAVVNLFDHIYEIRNGSGIGVFASQFGPRRAFYGGLRWDLPVGKAPTS